jgi:hypothetical protein
MVCNRQALEKTYPHNGTASFVVRSTARKEKRYCGVFFRTHTDSRSKQRVHFVKNSLFSRRDNKRRRTV